MSRLFDGVDDFVTFSPGTDLDTLHQGAMSLVYLIKINSSHRGGLYDSKAAGVRRFGVNPFDNGAGNVFFTIVGVGSVSVDYSSLIGEWGILAFTKPAGSAQARSHLFTYSGGTWSHADMGSVPGNGVTAVDTVYVGSFDGGQFLDANVAVVGLWAGTALADVDVEGLTDGLADWAALTPSVLWDFHGAVATPITDLMGSGADQTAITGTTDDAGDDPPGFSYSLSLTAELNPAAETDTALTFGRSKVRALAVAGETDAALTLARSKFRAVGLVAETDTALPLVRVKARTLGIAVDTSSAGSLARSKYRAVGIATETSSALTLGGADSPGGPGVLTAGATAPGLTAGATAPSLVASAGP